MNLKRNKNLTRFAVLLFILLVGAVFLTGCVRGMSPIGWSGAVVEDGIVYAGSKQGRLVAVELDTSVRRFAEPIRAPAAGGIGCGSTTACGGAPPAVAIYGTPALVEVPVLGRLAYIAGYNGRIYAYTADTLQQRWIYPIEGNLPPIVSAVIAADGMLYFGGTDGIVYALDAATGGERWRFPTGDQIWSTPAVENGILVIGSFDRTIYGIDAASGAERWTFPTGSTNVAPPLIVGDTVYIGSLDSTLYALNLNDGSERWRFTAGNWFWARPVEHNGIIYAPSLDNRVYGLDESGRNVVTFDIGGPIASSPVVVNNQVIVATEDARIWALDTDPAGFNRTDNRRQIAALPAGVEVTAPLAARGDMVYINASDNNLYIVNVANQTISSPISLAVQ